MIIKLLEIWKKFRNFFSESDKMISMLEKKVEVKEKKKAKKK